MSREAAEARRAQRRSNVLMGDKYGQVGAVIRNAYWREDYTVVSHNDDGTVTVRWHGRFDSLGLDRFRAGRETTHRTPLAPDDEVREPALSPKQADA